MRVMRVTWVPSGGLEETQETWPEFQQRLLEFEADQRKPDLSKSTADFAFSNPERQGFEKLDAVNTRKQKLDTELRKKITCDIHPTNLQLDIKPTGCCKFWMRGVDLVKYRAEQSPDPSLDTELSASKEPPERKDEIERGEGQRTGNHVYAAEPRGEYT
eukprot:1149770-Pelagomonas_calceolata.AAC.2